MLTTAIERSFDGGGAQALVLKFLNADLPIGEPPVLEPARERDAVDVVALVLAAVAARGGGRLFSVALSRARDSRESLVLARRVLSSVLTIVVMFGARLYSRVRA